MSRDLLSVTRFLAPGTETAQLREELRSVIDPELGIDIVSLGLVYGVEAQRQGGCRRDDHHHPRLPAG